MERGGTLGTTATATGGVTGGARTRVRTSCGCLFSFPLTLAVNEDFFRYRRGQSTCSCAVARRGILDAGEASSETG